MLKGRAGKKSWGEKLLERDDTLQTQRCFLLARTFLQAFCSKDSICRIFGGPSLSCGTVDCGTIPSWLAGFAQRVLPPEENG